MTLLSVSHTDQSPADLLAACGEVFACFDIRTQDSGNVSWGVRCGDERFFVKTAGAREDTKPFLSFDGRIALLRNAVRLQHAVADPSLPKLRRVIESADGPMLVYDWVEGELVGTPAERRMDAASPYVRFRALPAGELAAALEVVFRVHVKLAEKGWVACDFYDGCLIYDFARRDLHLVDLDTYHEGPFTNTMGRMFGSGRFMAPEEHQLGALIDQRTTVFNLGRTLQQFPPANPAAVTRVASRACEPNPGRRYQSVREFYAAWREATAGESAMAGSSG